MLRVADLHSYYGLAHVLQGVDLDVGEGRLVALLGRNGMGKTTLIRSIMGTAPPTVRGGSVQWRGTELLGLQPYQIARLGLGLVPQGRHVFRSLTVVENLTVAARAASVNGGSGWTVQRVFEVFPRLAERQTNRGSALSGGEQQMLAIGRALMTNPALLLMDEPSEGLAPLLVQQLGQQLQALKGADLTIFLVEQNLGLALRVADEIFILDRGEVVYRGSPAQLDADSRAKQRYLGVGH
jgi:branched-chain amino acid transport system ATP-binding protein